MDSGQLNVNMMKTLWICTACVCIMASANYAYLTASPGNRSQQKTFLLHDLHFCVSNTQHFSLSQYRDQYACIKRFMFHCILRHVADHSKHTMIYNKSPNMHVYCDAFSTNGKLDIFFDKELYLHSIKGHTMHIAILKFIFLSARYIQCAQHGMILNDTDNYCGIRVPWTMIFRDHKIKIHIAVTANKLHSLELFYSSFHPKWLAQYTSRELYHQSVARISSITITSKQFQDGITILEYIAVSDHNRVIYTDVIWSGSLEAILYVYDGPGPLSRKLLQIDGYNMSGHEMVQTTAYWAFVKIIIIKINEPVLLNIQIIAKKNAITARCPYKNYMFSFGSSKHRNVICSHPLMVWRGYIALSVRSLEFFGPTSLIEKADRNCQYGGIVLQFDNSGRKIYEYCEEVANFTVHGEVNWIHVTISWFSGYSRGHFIAFLDRTHCKTFYMELSPPRLIYKANVGSRANENFACHILVCPPLENYFQKTCYVIFGPSPVGTITTDIMRHNSLGGCDITGRETRNLTPRHRLKASYSDKWPFGFKKYSDHTYNTENQSIHTFKYMYNASLHVPLICEYYASKKQMAVMIKISMCVNDGGEKNMFIAQYTPALSASCLPFGFDFTLSNEKEHQSKNHIEFIYKETGHVNTGHDVSVTYTKCPMVCRRYKYSISVKSADEKHIRVYTSEVGHPIFTGYYHTGFRVTILQPEQQCVPCEFKIFVSEPVNKIGITNDNIVELSHTSYVFFENR